MDLLSKSTKRGGVGLLKVSSCVPTEDAAQTTVSEIPVEEMITINGVKYHGVTLADFVLSSSMGHGAHGYVMKYLHKASQTLVAIKEIHNASTEENRKLLRRQLQISKETVDCLQAVVYYGAFTSSDTIFLCMELMDTSMDHVYRILRHYGKRLPEDIIGVVALNVVQALHFLRTKDIIHRDVKPANILANRKGEIKICDYSISGILKNSVASSYFGHKVYMAPERIQPNQDNPCYTARADLWSLGITLIELATAHHPYHGIQGDFNVLSAIVMREAPQLPNDGSFSENFREFVSLCLKKKPEDRPKFEEMLQRPFLLHYQSDDNAANVADYMTSILNEYQSDFEHAGQCIMTKTCSCGMYVES